MSIIYFNNDFEVFISPSNNTHNYGEVEINALGTIWDLLLNKPYRLGGKPNSEWDLDSLKSAVSFNGTLNDSSDIDKYCLMNPTYALSASQGFRGYIYKNNTSTSAPYTSGKGIYYLGFIMIMNQSYSFPNFGCILVGEGGSV